MIYFSDCIISNMASGGEAFVKKIRVHWCLFVVYDYIYGLVVEKG